MRFRPGEQVSVGPINGITVVGHIELVGRALKVRIETGPRAGALTWPDGWHVGVGAHESRCQECGRPFRTDRAADQFCPSCAAGDEDEARAQAADPSRRSSSWEIAERRRRARQAS